MYNVKSSSGLSHMLVIKAKAIIMFGNKMHTLYFNIFDKYSEQDAQLSQTDRAAGCVIVFPKSGRLELGDNILRTV